MSIAPETDNQKDIRSALDMIAAERRRQIETEGWSTDHDDRHRHDELARAAACYATPANRRAMGITNVSRALGAPDDRGDRYIRHPRNWPWHPDWWKPERDDRVRELVKAAALIVAEIERLERLRLAGGGS